jgi:hypothetical protein
MSDHRLQRAYDEALRWMREELPRAEEAAARDLSGMLKKARQYLVAAEELTVDEAQKVVDVLRYDLREWAHHADETRLEMLDWARLDLDRLEHVIVDKLLSAADPTWVALNRFRQGREHLGEAEEG